MARTRLVKTVEEREERNRRILELHEKGITCSQIAIRVGIDRAAVGRLVKMGKTHGGKR